MDNVKIIKQFVDDINKKFPKEEELDKTKIDNQGYAFLKEAKLLNFKNCLTAVEKPLYEDFFASVDTSHFFSGPFWLSSKLENYEKFIGIGRSAEMFLCIDKKTYEIFLFDEYSYPELLQYVAPNFESFLNVLKLLNENDIERVKNPKYSLFLNIHEEIKKIVGTEKYYNFYEEAIPDN